MQYKDLKLLSEYDLWNICEYYDVGKGIEEIRRRTRLPPKFILKVLHYNSEFPLLDFSRFTNDFKKTEKYLKLILHFDFENLQHIELKPFLLEALQGYGKTQMIHYLFNIAYKYYIRQYIPEYEKELSWRKPSLGMLTIKPIITNDLSYLFANFPQSDVSLTAVDDADIAHDSSKHLKSDNLIAVENYWDIRHIQEKLYNLKKGLILNIFASHLSTSFLKRLRVSAKYIVYKNIFSNQEENWELRKKIGKRAFEFLEVVYHWRDISPIFSKFYILKSGNMKKYGKFEMSRRKFPEIYIEKETPTSQEEQILHALALRLDGFNELGVRCPNTYQDIQEVLNIDGNLRSFINRINNTISEVKEKYDLNIIRQRRLNQPQRRRRRVTT